MAKLDSFSSLIILSALLVGVIDKGLCLQTNEAKQKWAYVPVRANANMFWWLYYTTASEGYQNKPLVIWLQVSFSKQSTKT